MVRLNGDERRVAAGHTVATLLAELGVHRAAVVVERNRRIIRQESFDGIEIVDGDTLELVHFVGGG